MLSNKDVNYLLFEIDYFLDCLACRDKCYSSRVVDEDCKNFTPLPLFCIENKCKRDIVCIPQDFCVLRTPIHFQFTNDSEDFMYDF